MPYEARTNRLFEELIAMAWVALLNCNEIAPGESRRIDLDKSPPIAIYNLRGEYFATDDTCTHGEASLSEGDIAGDEIICPFHLGAFDIRTGAAVMAPCSEPLRTYRVRVDDETLYVEIDE